MEGLLFLHGILSGHFFPARSFLLGRGTIDLFWKVVPGHRCPLALQLRERVESAFLGRGESAESVAAIVYLSARRKGGNRVSFPRSALYYLCAVSLSPVVSDF